MFKSSFFNDMPVQYTGSYAQANNLNDLRERNLLAKGDVHVWSKSASVLSNVEKLRAALRARDEANKSIVQ